MTTAYPGGFDAFNNPGPETQRNDPGYEHSQQHSDVNDAVEAVQQELGLTPSGGFATVKERLDSSDQNTAITSSYWNFDALFADSDPGSGELRLNTAAKTTASFLYISDLNLAGVDISSFATLIDVGDKVFIQATDDPELLVRYFISAAATDAVGYWKIPVTVELASGGEFSASQKCQVIWSIAALGSGSGGASVWIGDNPPTTYDDGDMWYDTDEPAAVEGFPIDSVALHPTYGDDFAGLSLDAKWTRYNLSSANETFSNLTWMSTDITGYLPMAKQYHQPAPTGDFTVVLSMKMYVPYDTMIGPMIIDSSGAGVAWVPTDGWDLDTVLLSSYVRSAWGGYLEPIVWEAIGSGQRFWLALNKAGTTYKGRWSTDGMFWSAWSTPYTWAGNPTRVGFGRIEATSTYNTITSTMHIDRFNVEQ